MAFKKEVERRWQVVAQALIIVPYLCGDGYQIQIVHARSYGDMVIKERGATTHRFEKYFYVRNVSNKKAATLAAKVYFFAHVESIHLAGSTSEIRVDDIY